MPSTIQTSMEREDGPFNLDGREVEEWIGKDADTPIPKRVKLRVLLRQKGRCAITGHLFRPGDAIEYDHTIALCNGGENRERNIRAILGGKVHQAKTAADRAEKSKTDRLRAKHLGLWERKGPKIQSRGFRS